MIELPSEQPSQPRSQVESQERDEFQLFLESLKSDQEKQDFLNALMSDLDVGEEREVQLTPQQKTRIEQVKLMGELCKAVYIELSTESKTWASPVLKWWVGEETLSAKRAQLEKIMNQQLPIAAQKLALDANLTVEYSAPDLVKLFRDTAVTPVDFKEVQNEAELNLQRAQCMEYLRNLRQFEPLRGMAEDGLHAEFEAARVQVPEAEKTALYQEAEDKIYSMASEYKAAWAKEGITDEQAQEFLDALVVEEANRSITGVALADYFDPDSLLADKRAMWDVYNHAFDPQGEWLTVQDENFYFVLKELMVNAPLIMLSGGAASLARAGVSAGTRAFLEASSLAKYTTEAYKASRTLRAAAVLGGLTVEGTAFAVGHNAILKTLGLEEQWLLESPDAMQQVFWSCVTLGLFHGVGEGAKALGGAVDRGLASQFLKYKGVGNPAEFPTVLNSIAKDISNNAARQLIQNVIISGNLEAAAMLVLSAVQSGLYKGNLDQFFDQFGEELFHAYVMAGSLKAASGGASAAAEFAQAHGLKAAASNAPEVPSEVPVAPEAGREAKMPSPRKSKVDPEVVRRNAERLESERLEEAARLLGRPLTVNEETAIMKAHEVGAEGMGEYSKKELKEKAKILEEAGFSPSERRLLMENGICGFLERVAAALGGATESPVSRESFPLGLQVYTSKGVGQISGAPRPDGSYPVHINGAEVLISSRELEVNRAEAEAARAYGDLGRPVDLGSGRRGVIVGMATDGRYRVALSDGSGWQLVNPGELTALNPRFRELIPAGAGEGAYVFGRLVLVPRSSGSPSEGKIADVYRGADGQVRYRVNLIDGSGSKEMTVAELNQLNNKHEVGITVHTPGGPATIVGQELDGTYRVQYPDGRQAIFGELALNAYREQAEAAAAASSPRAPGERAEPRPSEQPSSKPDPYAPYAHGQRVNGPDGESLTVMGAGDRPGEVRLQRPNGQEVVVPSYVLDRMNRPRIVGKGVLNHNLLAHSEGYRTPTGDLVRVASDSGPNSKYAGENQDRGVYNPGTGEFTVIDGMGGMGGGERAAEILALEAAQKDIRTAARDAQMKMSRDASLDVGSGAVFVSGRVVAEGGRKRVDITWAGDAGAYLVHPDGSAQVLTRPHENPSTGAVTSAVTKGSPAKTIETGSVLVSPGDRVILISDGFEALTPDGIRNAVHGKNQADALAALDAAQANMANGWGKDTKGNGVADNRTVALMDIQ